MSNFGFRGSLAFSEDECGCCAATTAMITAAADTMYRSVDGPASGFGAGEGEAVGGVAGVGVEVGDARTKTHIPPIGKTSYTELSAESVTLIEMPYVPGEDATNSNFEEVAPGTATSGPRGGRGIGIPGFQVVHN